MKPIVHIYSQYYHPVSTPGANRAEKYVLALKDLYEVRVITGMPNYPTGIKEKSYKWRLYKYEIGRFGEHVSRVYELAAKNEGSIGRILNYLSFMFSSFLFGLFFQKPSVIIVTSPPLFVAIAVLLISKIRGIPYILEIRDLWPDSVVALGYMKRESYSFRLFSKIESLLYANATTIIGVTKGICQAIEDKGFSSDKIKLRYNTFLLNELHERNDVVKKYDIDTTRPIFLYAGNHSPIQKLENIIKFASDYQEGQFYFIGEGESKEGLERYVGENNINNVRFLGQVSRFEVYEFIRLSSFCLASLEKCTLFMDAIPTKILEYLAFDRPVICFLQGDLAEKIKEQGVGIASDEYHSNLPESVRAFCYVSGSGIAFIQKYFSFESFQTEILQLLSQVGKK